MPKPPTADDLAREPPGNDPDKQDDEQTLIGHGHWSPRHVAHGNFRQLLSCRVTADGSASTRSAFLFEWLLDPGSITVRPQRKRREPAIVVQVPETGRERSVEKNAVLERVANNAGIIRIAR